MRLSDHERATSTVTLSDEQFAKIVELLTPGYEVAKLYLAHMPFKPLLDVPIPFVIPKAARFEHTQELGLHR